MRIKYLLPALLLCVMHTQATNNYTLAEAIKKQLVQVKIHGAAPDKGEEFSGHYGPCLAAEITNTGAEALNINLDDGYKLEPTDTNYQTMMVTRNIKLTLLAKQKQNCRIYAMCCKAHNAAPREAINFNMGKRATGYLLQLAQLIDGKNYQRESAQEAVWCLTNDHSLDNIIDTDTTAMYAMRRLVAEAKKIPLSQVYNYSARQNSTVYQPEAPHITYTATINYSIPKTSKVMIGLYDENGTPKTIYVNNETQREGEYTYKYQISSTQIGDKKHYLRVYTDGRLYHEMTLIPQD